ncbi:MAG: bacillithiol biosynthesis protein BshC, partial [Candidatus Ranarchaeia archaeon]
NLRLENQRDLIESFEHGHRSRHSWTMEVRSAVKKMEKGTIEGSHQAVVLGGPGYVINKLACTLQISRILRLTPYFFIADYDQVQPELVNIRLPSNGLSGLLISLPFPPGYEHSPIYAIPVPEEPWVRNIVAKIRENYLTLTKELSRDIRQQVYSNIEQISQIILSTYFQAKSIGDWATRILDCIVNVYLGLGVPLIVSSQFRKLYQKGFEYLLKEKNRQLFIKTINTLYDELVSLNLEPGLKKRSRTYTPFFYECPNKRCHHARVELQTQKGNGKLISQGNCPICKEKISISVSLNDPDLTDHIKFISPRVDTRQMVTSSILPVIVHVGGPGETSYYSQVIPATQKMGLPTPVFYRYVRAFYNTPWNERTAESLKREKLPVLTSTRLFKNIRKWTKAKQKKDETQIKDAQFEIKDFVYSVRKGLTEKLKDLSKLISEEKTHADENSKRTTIKEHIDKANIIQRYLSNALGQFNPRKFGQEVSFSWIDIATLTGIKDLIGIYSRIYLPETPPAGFLFMNIRL